ncbi:hypothetical protein MU582_07170 [Nocardioidaceae bacterium SCSIO 66511]|nr:hypothetical protein MU582_07170 [Nocardioidaceae bacterium SCSIO 66511]
MTALDVPPVISTGAELGYPCAVCNDLTAQAPGDLCGFCSLTGVVMCTRCGGVQEQYGPCIHCETGR